MGLMAVLDSQVVRAFKVQLVMMVQLDFIELLRKNLQTLMLLLDMDILLTQLQVL